MFYFSESCTLCVFTYFPAIFYKQLRCEDVLKYLSCYEIIGIH